MNNSFIIKKYNRLNRKSIKDGILNKILILKFQYKNTPTMIK